MIKNVLSTTLFALIGSSTLAADTESSSMTPIIVPPAEEALRGRLSESDMARNEDDLTIIRAAADGNVKKLKQALKSGVNINICDTNGRRTALHMAADEGHTECMKILLAHPDIDVNQADIMGRTALIKAIMSDSTECVKLLLAHPDIDVNKQDGRIGNAAIHIAAGNNKPESLKLLLEKKETDVNLMHGLSGAKSTALCFAVMQGHTECVKLLLSHPKIDVNLTDDERQGPIVQATYYNHVECVKLLLAAPGIDVNRSSGKFTALTLAVYNNTPEIVKLLLQAPGIEVDKPSDHGLEPLWIAEDKGHKECADLLRAAGAIGGPATLVDATENGNAEKIRKILSKGKVDINLPGGSSTRRYIPLLRACELGNTACVQVILEQPGVNVNMADETGETSLMKAVKHNHTDCVAQLLAAPGIDVNATNKYGYTALISAASRGHTECVRLMLSTKETDVQHAAANGMTAMKAAEANGHDGIVQLLKQAVINH
ncbi:MAG: ankyrin repeat domain-containing protein [Akkermansia sp.]|nr:ankyrin repeat domain-containing protein [Akkermansia sp.]